MILQICTKLSTTFDFKRLLNQFDTLQDENAHLIYSKLNLYAYFRTCLP